MTTPWTDENATAVDSEDLTTHDDLTPLTGDLHMPDNCYMDETGTCHAAGTEACDIDCPFRDEQ